MKPNFALDLNQDGIGLLHRAGTSWLWLGSVPLNAPRFARRLQALRREASVFERDGMTTKIVIPNSEILYAELHAPGPGSSARIAQIREGLRQLTPCDVDDLVFDWRPSGHHAQVAAVARETLHEAETFAVGHRFNPVSLVAVPEPDRFEGEPFFGATAHAAGLLANGDLVEPDIGAMAVIGRGRRNEGDRKEQQGFRNATAGSANYTTETANGYAPLPDPERESSATATSGDPSPRSAVAGGPAAAKVAGKLERSAPSGEDRLGQQNIREAAAGRIEPERGPDTEPAQAGDSVGGRKTGEISPKTAPRFAREPPPPESESVDVDAGLKSGRFSPAAANASGYHGTTGQIPANRKEEKPSPRILLLEAERKAKPERPSGPSAARGSVRPGGMGRSGNSTRVSASQLAFSFLDDPDPAEDAPKALERNVEAENSALAATARPGDAPFVDTDAPIPGPGDSARPRAPRDVARRGKSATSTHSQTDMGENATSGSVEPSLGASPAAARAMPPANIDRAAGPSGGKGRTTRKRNKSSATEHPALDFNPAPANGSDEFDFGEPSASTLRATAPEKPSEEIRRASQRRRARPEPENPAFDFGDTSACKQAKLDFLAPPAARHRSPPPEKPPFGGEETIDPSDGNGRETRRWSGAPTKEHPAPDRVAAANGQSGANVGAKAAIRNSSPPSGKPALVADGAARASVAHGRAPQRPPRISAWAAAALALVALAAIGAIAISFGNPTPADRTDESGQTGALAEPSAEAPPEPGRLDAEASGASLATANLRQPDPETTPERDGDGAAAAPPGSRAIPSEDKDAAPEQDSGTPSPQNAFEPPKESSAAPRIRPEAVAPKPGSGASEDSRGVAAFATPLPRPTGRFGAVVSRAPVLRPTVPAETGIGVASTQAIRNPRAPFPRPDDIRSIAEAAFAASLQASPTGVSVERAATQRDALDPGRINLIGVYGSETGRRAIVRLQSGRFVTVEAGDRMDGGRVFAIGEGELSYVKGGRSHLLRMPKG